MKIYSKLLMVAILICIPVLKFWAQSVVPIYTKSDLRNIKNDWEGSYLLMNDLDFSGDDWLPIGLEDWTSGNITDAWNFKGIFDGQGHTLSNITVNTTLLATPAPAFTGALFIKISGGTVKNLILENVDITGGNLTGGLCGTMFCTPAIGGGRPVLVEKVSVTGKITGNGEVGGITARCNDNILITIKDCSVNAIITGNDIDKATDGGQAVVTPGKVNVGGIVGSAATGKLVVIENCLVQGEIIATTAQGNELNPAGLIGWSNATVANTPDIQLKNSVVAAEITGSTKAFFGGSVYGSAMNPTSCYVLDDTGLTVQGDESNGVATVVELQTQSFYEEGLEWDFDDVWQIKNTGEFPVLQWPQATGLISVNADNDKILGVRYYNLQGMEISKPVENGIYIVKTIYESKKVEVSKKSF